MAFQTNNSFQLLKKRDQNYCGAWLPTKLNFHINDTLFFALYATAAWASLLLCDDTWQGAARDSSSHRVDMVDAGSQRRSSVQKKE